jgi:hypothetical protein
MMEFLQMETGEIYQKTEGPTDIRRGIARHARKKNKLKPNASEDWFIVEI